MSKIFSHSQSIILAIFIVSFDHIIRPDFFLTTSANHSWLPKLATESLSDQKEYSWPKDKDLQVHVYE